MVFDTCLRTVSQQSWPVINKEDQWCPHSLCLWVRFFTFKCLNLTFLTANINLTPNSSTPYPFASRNTLTLLTQNQPYLLLWLKQELISPCHSL
jgi:hypothetical protein